MYGIRTHIGTLPRLFVLTFSQLRFSLSAKVKLDPYVGTWTRIYVRRSEKPSVWRVSACVYTCPPVQRRVMGRCGHV